MSTEGVTKKMGLIGLGLMGLPMGVNLRKAGFPLTVWNRLPMKATALPCSAAGIEGRTIHRFVAGS